MAKRKTVRKLAGLDALAGLATIGVLGARSMARSREAAREALSSPRPPRTSTWRSGLEKLQDEIQQDIELGRISRGEPVITPEEHAETMHDIKGVRDSSDIPIKAGDSVLQESNPSMRPVRPREPALKSRVGFGLKSDHYLGKSLETLDPATDSVDPRSWSYNKKGGAVKGWGKARGARKAKVY